jgi:hypothetical protein
VLFALLLVTCALWAQGPVIEYGKPEELKGVTKIYIYTGTDIEVRQNIIKEIAKKLPSLQIADKPEEAQVFLLFAADSSTFLSSLQTTSENTGGGTTSSSTPIYRRVISATGAVAKPIGPNRVRLLMDFKDSRSTVFERRPSTNFARKFVEAYLKVNGKHK